VAASSRGSQTHAIVQELAGLNCPGLERESTRRLPSTRSRRLPGIAKGLHDRLLELVSRRKREHVGEELQLG
jgi:hypothetical protein